MNHLLAKIKGRGQDFYKVMSESDVFFDLPDLSDAHNYSPAHLLNENEWHKLNQFSTLGFTNSLIATTFNTTNYNQLPQNKYLEVEYFCSKQGDYLLFQKIKANQIFRKRLIDISAEPRLETNKSIIVLNEHVDAVYNVIADILYFEKVAPLKVMFNGIEKIYRDATDQEVTTFLSNNFITLQNGYSALDVKTANRKRIAQSIDILSRYSQGALQNIFSYIQSYCPQLQTSNNQFIINNEKDLKMVLYGIDERFYTTTVGMNKRLANSVQEI
jgi:hypothetical protein